MDALVSNTGQSSLGETKPGCSGPAAGMNLEGAAGGYSQAVAEGVVAQPVLASQVHGSCNIHAGTVSALRRLLPPPLRVLARQEQQRGWHGLSLTLPKPLLCPKKVDFGQGARPCSALTCSWGTRGWPSCRRCWWISRLSGALPVSPGGQRVKVVPPRDGEGMGAAIGSCRCSSGLEKVTEGVWDGVGAAGGVTWVPARNALGMASSWSFASSLLDICHVCCQNPPESTPLCGFWFSSVAVS